MTGFRRSSSTNARQLARQFETNFLKYLSIYNGVVRDTIEEQDLQLAAAVFEDEIRLVPSDDDTIEEENTQTVGMEELKLMMLNYLKSGTQFELLEVHVLKTAQNQKRGNIQDSASTSVSSSTSPSSEMGTVRIQYSARIIKANGDSEIGTSRITLSATGRIASVINTPSNKSNDNNAAINNEVKDEACPNGIEFHLVVGTKGASKTFLRTPVFQSL